MTTAYTLADENVAVLHNAQPMNKAWSGTRIRPHPQTFWTMSAWDDDAALVAFARSDVHRAAMTALQPHMNDARIETFTLSGSEVPPRWPDVARKLTATVTP